MKKEVYFFHLLNDFSGSPNILSQVVKVYKEDGFGVNIITSRGEGFLSNIATAKYSTYTYKWSPNKMVTLLRLFYVQLVLFFKVLFLKNLKGNVVYINTLLPFGPALAGKLRGAKVVYHVHESYIKPAIFRRFLTAVAGWSARKVIMVSNYLYEEYPTLQHKSMVIGNALPQAFLSKITEGEEQEKPFTVLMLASLKAYKGVDQFVKIAELLPDVVFELVLNAKEEEVKAHFKHLPTLNNLRTYASQSDVHPFYRNAAMVLNLTIPELCKESFGMTILEAKAYGLPAIVPPAGGPKELVINGKDGYLIHPKEVVKIAYIIQEIAEDKVLYSRLKNNAATSFDDYSFKTFREKVLQVVS